MGDGWMDAAGTGIDQSPDGGTVGFLLSAELMNSMNLCQSLVIAVSHWDLPRVRRAEIIFLKFLTVSASACRAS